jgi:hypothetical protein
MLACFRRTRFLSDLHANYMSVCLVLLNKARACHLLYNRVVFDRYCALDY